MTEINWIIYVNKNEKYATSHGLAPKYVVKYLRQYLKIYIIITLFSLKICVANFLDTGSKGQLISEIIGVFKSPPKPIKF